MTFAVLVADFATLSIATATSLLPSSTRSCVDSPVVKKLATRASTISVEPRQGRRVYAVQIGKAQNNKEKAQKT